MLQIRVHEAHGWMFLVCSSGTSALWTSNAANLNTVLFTVFLSAVGPDPGLNLHTDASSVGHRGTTWTFPNRTYKERKIITWPKNPFWVRQLESFYLNFTRNLERCLTDGRFLSRNMLNHETDKAVCQIRRYAHLV